MMGALCNSGVARWIESRWEANEFAASFEGVTTRICCLIMACDQATTASRYVLPVPGGPWTTTMGLVDSCVNLNASCCSWFNLSIKLRSMLANLSSAVRLEHGKEPLFSNIVLGSYSWL